MVAPFTNNFPLAVDYYMNVTPSTIQAHTDHSSLTMDKFNYSIPKGLYAIPGQDLDTRPDAEIDHDLLHPRPVTDEKNVWFFWHSGYANMHAYTKRNIRAWHRRFSKRGWAIRVVDREQDSPLNIARFLDINDPDTFPRAFVDGLIGGTYGIQHT